MRPVPSRDSLYIFMVATVSLCLLCVLILVLPTSNKRKPGSAKGEDPQQPAQKRHDQSKPHATGPNQTEQRSENQGRDDAAPSSALPAMLTKITLPEHDPWMRPATEGAPNRADLLTRIYEIQRTLCNFNGLDFRKVRGALEDYIEYHSQIVDDSQQYEVRAYLSQHLIPSAAEVSKALVEYRFGKNRELCLAIHVPKNAPTAWHVSRVGLDAGLSNNNVACWEESPAHTTSRSFSVVESWYDKSAIPFLERGFYLPIGSMNRNTFDSIRFIHACVKEHRGTLKLSDIPEWTPGDFLAENNKPDPLYTESMGKLVQEFDEDRQIIEMRVLRDRFEELHQLINRVKFGLARHDPELLKKAWDALRQRQYEAALTSTPPKSE